MPEKVLLFKSRFLLSPRLVEGYYYPEQGIITTSTGKSGTFYKISETEENLGIPGLRGFIRVDKLAPKPKPLA